MIAKVELSGRARTACAVGFAIAFAGAAAAIALRADAHKLWLDDFYTVYLVGGSLPDLFGAIVQGIDGNPPLYMLLAWVTARLPFPAAAEAKLFVLNVAIAGATLIVLFRLARVFVAFEAALAALALLLLTNFAFIEPVLHPRAYPLYLLCAAAAALTALRWQECGARRDGVLFALACVALALSHTFGLAYALMIAGSAGVVSAVQAGVRQGLRVLAPVLPAVLVMALWLPALISQLTVAVPYGWIEAPPLHDLFRPVLPGTLAGLAGAAMLLVTARIGLRRLGSRACLDLLADRKLRTAALALAAFTLFACAVWLASRLGFPLFVTRYFTPNLLVYYGIVVAFAGCMHAVLPRGAALRATAASAALGMLATAVAAPTEGTISCFDADRQRFLEAGAIDAQLPVVTESPHAWFPRTYYSPTPAQYIFPLDWDVVLRFPRKERNNAVDFHIMQRFQRITGIPTILSTAQLIERQKEFYVLNERSRAWLDNLRGRYQLHETVVASSSSCALVRVRVTDAPARAVL